MLVFLLNLLIVFRIVRISNLTLKIVVDFIMSMIGVSMVNGLYFIVYGYIYNRTDFTVDWAGTILNGIIILMGIELVYYFKHLVRSREETEEARRKALQYRYDSLKAQVNPHFLFNSLNLLHSLVSIDQAQSKSFIYSLASMYRYILAKHNTDKVDAKEEFEFLDSYISVLDMRYDDKLKVSINGELSEGKQLIPFTLQLLIENVTKHNIISAKKPMSVNIHIKENEIIVSNPIIRSHTVNRGGFGLEYLKELYAAYGRNFRIDNDGETFTAHVPLL